MIKYTTGCNPTEIGVYACRVPDPLCSALLLDIFLIWSDGKWSYLKSDQFYRGDVLGWVGPLQRRL